MVGVLLSFVASLAPVCGIRLRVLSVGMLCSHSISPSGLFFVIDKQCFTWQAGKTEVAVFALSMAFTALVVPPRAANDFAIRTHKQKNSGSYLTTYSFAYRCTSRFYFSCGYAVLFLCSTTSFYCKMPTPKCVAQATPISSIYYYHCRSTTLIIYYVPQSCF